MTMDLTYEAWKKQCGDGYVDAEAGSAPTPPPRMLPGPDTPVRPIKYNGDKEIDRWGNT